ncbi:class I SAM-dependent methyltransferase [Sphingomonas koreensis]|nr:class I SAM-dependent methyltransferase [Sphingomonas koreensis]
MKGHIGTAAFYDREADSYAAATVGLDMSADYARFLSRIRPGGWILDAGSGSGRDTLAFLDRGFEVSAFDASPSMAACSSRLTGRTTLVRTFSDVDERDCYDGIWASASLLHVPDLELDDAWDRLVHALRVGGTIYASFKLGEGDAVAADGRLFHLLSERRLFAMVERHALIDVDVAISASMAGRRGDTWLSVVAGRRGLAAA